jgi:hypothetical protein
MTHLFLLLVARFTYGGIGRVRDPHHRLLMRMLLFKKKQANRRSRAAHVFVRPMEEGAAQSRFS